jgi:hypothetical protein
VNPGSEPDQNLTGVLEGDGSRSGPRHAGGMQSLQQGDRGVVPAVVADAVAEAIGRERREDPVLAPSGGPAGNALLTAWTALVLLAGSVAELLTLVDINGLLSWHVAIGALLVPPALLKTASTGWRIVRYYAGSPTYRQAGPPPLLLRFLGPLVVVSTLGLLGSGVLLVVLGEPRAHRPLVDLLGFRVDWVTLHQGFFAAWVVATGLHLLGRIVPALRITMTAPRGSSVPGSWARWLVLAVAVSSAAALAVALVHADGSWIGSGGFEGG